MQTKGQTKLTSLLLLLLTITVQSGEIPKPINVGGVPYHPYRKVGERYYDLTPIYEWSKVLTAPGNKLTAKQRESRRPMTEWIGMPSRVNDPVYVDYRILQVANNGLLVTEKFNAYKIGTQSQKVIFLKNYPWAGSVAEGQSFDFLALKTGVYNYTDVAGASRTVELYDYGTPYHPALLAAERSKTNSYSNKTNATNKTNAIVKP